MRDAARKSRVHAKRFRQNMTEAEVILWALLRRNATGWRFRRQHPIGPYIADFACIARRLVIEVDGATHGRDRAAFDARRTQFMESQGWSVLRFGNFDIYDNLDGVGRKILEVLGPAPASIPRLRRGLPPRAGEER